jgi:hypothetical protein
MYKLTGNSTDGYGIKRLSDSAFIPRAGGNRDYQQFLRDVKREGLSIVEGDDVVEPNYVALRTGTDGYAPIAEQLDVITKNGVEALQELNNAVKTRYPKTIVGGVTIAPVPDWVLEESDKVVLREDL